MMPNSPKLALKALLQRWLQPEETPPIDGLVLASINRAFEALSPQRRIEQALELLPGAYVLTSSFGAQAAVMLHLVTRVLPDIPVVLRTITCSVSSTSRRTRMMLLASS